MIWILYYKYNIIRHYSVVQLSAPVDGLCLLVIPIGVGESQFA